MGVVYKAVDRRLGRSVAIKTLSEKLAEDPEFLSRFEREAKALGALNHPNIAGIYDVQLLGEKRFLIMEFVEGESLFERLLRGPLRVSEALELGSQIASALSAAHEAGFIHRDLKPANIKVTPEGVAKVLDFGLVGIALGPSDTSVADDRTAEHLSHLRTEPGTVLGTVLYMSPEQVRGGKADRRTDLWSLGVVLYECLTGENPFQRGSAGECLAATLHEEPDFKRLPKSTPSEVVSMVRRCLQKDLAARQRDAGDCRLILEDAKEVLWSEAPEPVETSAISDRRLRIGDDACRSLDRDGFDSLLPGWEMQYADNNHDSEVLVVWVPSIGGDHTTSQWRELISATRYRAVVVTPVGMEPAVEHRPVVSLENQFALMRALTRHLRLQLNPSKVVISGFSCGSIMALRCAAGDESEELFDGVLAIDPDLEESDCFLTRLFAHLDASSATNVMKGLRTVSGSCTTVDEWLVLHEHMIECVEKVQNDFSPLIRQGRDLSEAYEGVRTGADSPFVGFLRDAIARVGAVRCVFHDSPGHRRILGEMRMLHLDREVFGPGFSDDIIEFVPVTDHVGMMSNERLLEQLERMVDTVLH